MGPQQREIRKAFRQAKQVGVGPQQKDFPKESQRTKRVGVAETAL
ncbi:PTS cellobiose transporter subunit IIBC [Staphylococcus sp. HMSC059F04]|nr:PTS cellobiose transporter subunit IIBC [Staphylococcus sp. HMSC077E12]OFR86131.1 PTS cellobiose transporter subunit IIBC [Staphylococcus sp. HMSC059F04]OHQ43165.1 PTS cellobiose transporter subunit IIBC [Staphylococcus sp. HMSC070D07]